MVNRLGLGSGGYLIGSSRPCVGDLAEVVYGDEVKGCSGDSPLPLVHTNPVVAEATIGSSKSLPIDGAIALALALRVLASTEQTPRQ